MWEDPIVKETRELRKQFASKFKNDADAIFEDILKRQEQSKLKRIAFPARKPKSRKKFPDNLPKGKRKNRMQLPA